MYKKHIRTNNRKYTYYYHNVKIKGKVKNIFLSDNKREALDKLEGLINKNAKKEIINENFAPKNIINVFLLMFALTIIINLLYYFNPQFTGLTIYNADMNNIINFAREFRIKEILGLLISLETMFFGYTIYKDYKNYKVKII